LYKKSTTTVKKFSINFTKNSIIYLTGTILYDSWNNKEPTFKYFIHNVDNPSYKNYLQTITYKHLGSGTDLNDNIFIDKEIFPSGTQIYLIAYGCNSKDDGYFDILSNQQIFSSLGPGTPVVSITIP
jgi:hypothetical protein